MTKSQDKEKENLIYTNGLGTFWGEDGEKISTMNVETIFKNGYSQALEECLKHSENIETEFDLGKFRLWIKKELEGKGK